MAFTFNEATINISYYQHKMPGLGDFTFRFVKNVSELTICYSKEIINNDGTKEKIMVEIEKFEGEEAKKVFSKFNKEFEKIEILPAKEVIKVAANSCKIESGKLKTKDRHEEVVWARYLFYYYYKTFSKYSLAYIGEEFGHGHANVLHGLEEVNNPKLNSWRKDYKTIFKNEINSIHETLGIKKFKDDTA